MLRLEKERQAKLDKQLEKSTVLRLTRNDAHLMRHLQHITTIHEFSVETLLPHHRALYTLSTFERLGFLKAGINEYQMTTLGNLVQNQLNRYTSCIPNHFRIYRPWERLFGCFFKPLFLVIV